MEMAEGGSFIEVSAYGPAECRVIALGKVGSGKSKTGNSLLGRKAFISYCSAKAVTERCQLESALRFGKKLVYVDTPGLLDTEMSTENLLIASIKKKISKSTAPSQVIGREVLKSIQLSSPGPHAFLFITKVGRFTPNEKHTIDHCEKLFGKEFYKHLVIVLTNKKKLDDDKTTLEQFIDEAPSDFKDILRKNDHACIAIENNSCSEEIEEQMKKLFSLITNVVEKNEGHHFTDTTYVQMQENPTEDNRRRQLCKCIEFLKKASRFILKIVIPIVVLKFVLEKYLPRQISFGRNDSHNL